MLLSTYPFINSVKQLGKLTIRQYNMLLSKAFDIAGIKAGVKIELETFEEKITRAERELEQLKAKGEWIG